MTLLVLPAIVLVGYVAVGVFAQASLGRKICSAFPSRMIEQKIRYEQA